ncbi:surface protease GP63 [Trypanosoma theileri]|uniref:Leishmanolysin-like peptidase n=1 Tax=Trypanosoma theileri TaxID=67003 RepID=A0A1X0NQU4_9TRYP|nr:surface protease GP63 [Trypanosoma theileri]ORC87085.1 surface protease GP63 [Trypanosoma theileri]
MNILPLHNGLCFFATTVVPFDLDWHVRDCSCPALYCAPHSFFSLSPSLLLVSFSTVESIHYMPQQVNKLSARTPATVRQSLYVMPLLLLLLFLCCACVCVAQKDGGVQSTGVVRELPRKGQSGLQAYTVSAQEKDDKEWKLIRIKAFTKDLDNKSRYCTKVDDKVMDFQGDITKCYENEILTDKKKETLINEMIPAAIKLHRDRLRVQPHKGNLTVPPFQDKSYCKHFTVPDEHHDKGVENADFVLYVAAGTGEPFGVTCAPAEASSRPIAGAINISPYYLVYPRGSVRAVAHEMAHALGFDYERMEQLKMVTKANVRGMNRKLVSSKRTKEKAQAHYNCSTLEGMELQLGSGDKVQSHWTHRNAKDELMAPTDSLGAGYYTALTMSTFEDMGYYRANWGMEEPMGWGNHSGCDFFEALCIVNNAAKYPEMFCSESVSRCTTDRSSPGYCSVPASYHWESEKNLCPFTKPDYGKFEEKSRYVFCFSDDVPALDGSLMGNDSWCLDGESLHVNFDDDTVKENVAGVCALVSCDESSRTVKVQYNGSDEWHDCPEGKSIEAKSPTFKSGNIKCPKYDEVCTIAPNGGSRLALIDPPDDPTPSPDGGGGGGGTGNAGGGGGHGDGCATAAPIALSAIALMVITLMLLP